MSTGNRRRVETGDGRIGGVLCLPDAIEPAAPLLVCVHGSGCDHRYFDLRSNSLVDAAASRGIPLLLLDRPGYGLSSPPPDDASAISYGVDALRLLIAQTRRKSDEVAERPLALLGHSFGGAVALSYAAQDVAGEVCCLCVSGIGDIPDADYAAAAIVRSASNSPRPAPAWLFGPGISYDWRGVSALRATAQPWLPGEVYEISQVWPTLWSDVTGRVTCAVHFRVAEFERIWQADEAALTRIARSFVRASTVDVAIAPDGGHLYEAHLRGAELVASQLDFVLQQGRMLVESGR